MPPTAHIVMMLYLLCSLSGQRWSSQCIPLVLAKLAYFVYTIDKGFRAVCVLRRMQVSVGFPVPFFLRALPRRWMQDSMLFFFYYLTITTVAQFSRMWVRSVSCAGCLWGRRGQRCLQFINPESALICSRSYPLVCLRSMY